MTVIWDSPRTPSCVRLSLPLPCSSLRRHRRPSLLNIFHHPPSLLLLYFALNFALTLYNKSLLLAVPLPYSLSALHALATGLGSSVLLGAPPPRLPAHQATVILAFSVLYTANIAISNVSLGLVTVPFHQVVRASTPLFTIIFSALILHTRSSTSKLIALIPVVAGVGFATYGDYYFTPWGFFLTALGTLLAALKTVYTNLLQKPSSACSTSSPSLLSSQSDADDLLQPSPVLSPLELLYVLSPLAFVQSSLLALLSGELPYVRQYLFSTDLQTFGFSTYHAGLLLLNGVTAFALNVVSFSANKKVGAVSMTVASNVKQVLTVMCAVFLFDLRITPMNGFGIMVTLAGGALYAWVDLRERALADTEGKV